MRRTMMAVGSLLTAAVVCGAENTLTDKEKAEGWKLLWDGKTTEGWRSVRKPEFPEKGWVIKDGEMEVVPKGGGGDIITAATYTNFILMVDFRLTKAANSGIKYFIDPKVNGGTSLEYQILDPAHGDAKQGIDGNRRVATVYDVLPAPEAEALLKPLGEWNTAMIVCKGMNGEHWLNGKQVLAFERGSEAWKAAVAKSKFKDHKDWGETQAGGHILLQEHQDQVWFRNVKIKVLD